MNIAGVHHVTLRVQDPARSRKFYEDVLQLQFMEIPVTASTTSIWRGKPESGALIATQVGSTFLILAPPLDGVGTDARFHENNLGMDHLAFAATDRAELDDLVSRLRAAGASTEGVETDPVLNKDYVAFRDPDNVQVECYMV